MAAKKENAKKETKMSVAQIAKVMQGVGVRTLLAEHEERLSSAKNASVYFGLGVIKLVATGKSGLTVDCAEALHAEEREINARVNDKQVSATAKSSSEFKNVIKAGTLPNMTRLYEFAMTKTKSWQIIKEVCRQCVAHHRKTASNLTEAQVAKVIRDELKKREAGGDAKAKPRNYGAMVAAMMKSARKLKTKSSITDKAALIVRTLTAIAGILKAEKAE